MAVLVACALAALGGCSRRNYRLQADAEAYQAIGERNADPRWHVDSYSIQPDPRSRYFDPYDPDRSPMPLDDPASHQYMQYVNGMKGWQHWSDNGERCELENPHWREALADYVQMNPDGTIRLTLDSSLKLAYLHSPAQQLQLETLYLSALDVTAERFRLDTQFFGGYDARYTHQGSLVPAGLGFNSAAGRFAVTPPFHGPGVENNRLILGRPAGTSPTLQLQRRFATAGELLVGFANSFVFEFTGDDASLAASLANFSIVQPLLRGAGRDIALEQLTKAERDLLANLRAYSQYRQGFYTQVAIGELGVSGPRRGGSSTTVSSFSGQAGLGGYLGLLQQLQRIRNTEDNLYLQLRTLAQLEALLDVGVIDMVQVDQFRQSIENERANLLRDQNTFELALDRFKKDTLGLPPDLPVQLDDTLIRQFQLISREATAVQDAIVRLQDRVGELPADASVDEIGRLVSEAFRLLEPIGKHLDDTGQDLDRMDKVVPRREQSMTDVERRLFERDRKQLRDTQADLRQKFGAATGQLKGIRDGLAEPTRDATVRQLVMWLGSTLRMVQRAMLVQARARLEAVTVETIQIDPQQAFRTALPHRLDFMNARAALVDRWRQIQIDADALQSVLNVTASGDLRTARNNAVSFRAPAGSLRLGLEFDAPLTRLLERNNYRQSLVEYQQSRRSFIQSRDALKLSLRELLRQIKRLRTDLEIQRRAVAIAIRRVDMTRAAFYAPVPPPRPGQRPPPFGPTAARDLLTALSALRDTQNNFMSVWLNYYAARMRLAREMGVMLLDEQGRWTGTLVLPAAGEEAGAVDAAATALQVPPSIPASWMLLGDAIQQQLGKPPVHPAGSTAGPRGSQGPLRRLPPTDTPADPG